MNEYIGKDVEMDDIANKKVGVHIRFGSKSAGFILPDEREAFRAYMNQERKADKRMTYLIHCHVSEYQFYETRLDGPDEVIDYIFGDGAKYNALRVFEPQENGMFNCSLAVRNGRPQWGEPSLLQSARIREQELDYWPEIAANPAYKRVTAEQVDAWYRDHYDDVMGSIWPEMPELCEVISFVAKENNPGLFRTATIVPADKETAPEISLSM